MSHREYDNIEQYLDHAVSDLQMLHSWKEVGDNEFLIEGDGIRFGQGFTKKVLQFGYIPKSCTENELRLAPLTVL